jgi:hypothetical protein
MVNNRLRDKRGDDAGCPPVSGSVKGGSVIRARDRQIARDEAVVWTACVHYECVSISCRSDILARVGLERNVESAMASRGEWIQQPRELVGFVAPAPAATGEYDPHLTPNSDHCT